MSTREIQFFSSNLQRARGSLSQAQFARLLGIKNQQTYQRYESGENAPNAVTLHRIAVILGVTGEALLTENGVMEPIGERLADGMERSGTATRMAVRENSGPIDFDLQPAREWENRLAAFVRGRKRAIEITREKLRYSFAQALLLHLLEWKEDEEKRRRGGES